MIPFVLYEYFLFARISYQISRVWWWAVRLFDLHSSPFTSKAKLNVCRLLDFFFTQMVPSGKLHSKINEKHWSISAYFKKANISAISQYLKFLQILLTVWKLARLSVWRNFLPNLSRHKYMSFVKYMFIVHDFRVSFNVLGPNR